MQIVGLLMVLGSTGYAGVAINEPAGEVHIAMDEPALLAKLVREYKHDNSLYLMGDTLETNLNPAIFSEAELLRMVSWYDREPSDRISRVGGLACRYLERDNQTTSLSNIPMNLAFLRHAQRAYVIFVRVVDPHDVVTFGIVPFEYSEEDYQTIVRLTT
jgi:hypothetical protein